jgi:hypothetical protein
LIHHQFRLTSVVPCLLIGLLLHMQVVLLHSTVIECHLLLILVNHRLLVSPNLLGVCGLSKSRLMSELLLVHLVLVRDLLLLLIRDLLLVGVVVSWPA